MPREQRETANFVPNVEWLCLRRYISNSNMDRSTAIFRQPAKNQVAGALTLDNLCEFFNSLVIAMLPSLMIMQHLSVRG